VPAGFPGTKVPLRVAAAPFATQSAGSSSWSHLLGRVFGSMSSFAIDFRLLPPCSGVVSLHLLFLPAQTLLRPFKALSTSPDRFFEGIDQAWTSVPNMASALVKLFPRVEEGLTPVGRSVPPVGRSVPPVGRPVPFAPRLSLMVGTAVHHHQPEARSDLSSGREHSASARSGFCISAACG
jgi:hypothetical protein